MTPTSIHRITSIGRPLDPDYATNRAVLWLMPAGGALAALAWVLRGHGEPIAAGTAALVGAAAVFGCWALTRELAPDDNPAAFVSMGLGLAASSLADAPSLLLLFVTLLLARVVNRTVGLPATVLDSVSVAGLTVWATVGVPAPLLGVVGGLTFAGDAVLHDGRRRQLIFAVVCLAAAGMAVAWSGPTETAPAPLTKTDVWVAAIVGVAYAAAIVGTRRVESVGDATGAPLSLPRVRGGMLIGLLVALQGLAAGSAGFDAAALVWACAAGVALGRAGGWVRRRVARGNQGTRSPRGEFRR